MKVTTIIAFLMTLVISPVASASIHRSIDNNVGGAVYETSKKIMRWNTVDMLDFQKTARPDHQDNMIIRVQFCGPGRHKLLAQETGYVIVDDIEYPVKKFVYPIPVPGAKRQMGVCSVTYIIPDEIQNRISQFENSVVFKFGVQGKEYTIFKVNRKEQEEIRLIAGLKYEDFEGLENESIKPRPIDKE